MSKKTFRESLFLVFGGRIVCILLLITVPYILFGPSIDHSGMNSGESIFAYMSMLVLEIMGIWVLKALLWQRCFGKLVLKDDMICYRCFPLRPKTIHIQDCNYIGIADFRKHYREENLSKNDLYINTVCVAIFFSTEPYPQEFDGLVDQLQSRKGFIKFAYTDELAEAIISRWPHKAKEISGFYHIRKSRMKQNRRARKRRHTH